MLVDAAGEIRARIAFGPICVSSAFFAAFAFIPADFVLLRPNHKVRMKKPLLLLIFNSNANSQKPTENSVFSFSEARRPIFKCEINKQMPTRRVNQVTKVNNKQIAFCSDKDSQSCVGSMFAEF